MPLRRAPPLRVPVVASLPKATPPDELLRTVMQHVLFMHQQIPCVYAELHDFLPGRAGLMRRKATKLLSVMEPLLAELLAATRAQLKSVLAKLDKLEERLAGILNQAGTPIDPSPHYLQF